MRHILIISLIIYYSEATAQQLIVADSKESFYIKGRKIKKGEKIDFERKIKINDGGQLGLEYGRWTFYLNSGVYDMDSVLRGQKRRREFIVDDSIYTVLKKLDLLNCRKEGIQCMDVNKFLNPNRKNENTVLANGDSVVLKWDDRQDYKGLYYILFLTMFNEFIQLETTYNKELEINLLPFKSQKSILYKVISADCIESDLMLIRLE